MQLVDGSTRYLMLTHQRLKKKMIKTVPGKIISVVSFQNPYKSPNIFGSNSDYKDDYGI